MKKKGTSRREFLKKTTYVAPVILTLNAKASFAGTGSGRCEAASSTDSCNDGPETDIPNWLQRLIERILELLRRG